MCVCVCARARVERGGGCLRKTQVSLEDRRLLVLKMYFLDQQHQHQELVGEANSLTSLTPHLLASDTVGGAQVSGSQQAWQVFLMPA